MSGKLLRLCVDNQLSVRRKSESFESQFSDYVPMCTTKPMQRCAILWCKTSHIYADVWECHAVVAVAEFWQATRHRKKNKNKKHTLKHQI